ncbi:MAG TPA: RAMP superfamily CRISPR-associated protein [Thermoanaerobaculia bacterium]|jgi:CRISPR-associated RAMP protein (TIGR02581 family)|nr:RAMP superfamily CRISPR-associated protein [Thermoanaerobaculia bacterium]
MFQTLQNTVTLEMTLVPDGPVLVRAQSVGLDPGIADMEFQRTRRDGKSTVFLAGSGLKGVLRAHSERILRAANRFACDPTHTKDDPTTCGTRKKDAADPAGHYPHQGNCAACFTFGSLKLAGRFRIGDAFPPPELEAATNATEVRTSVGIDRQSQAAKTSALYDTEVVVAGGFRATIQGESFPLWQLGLVLEALRHLDAGLVRIGGGKARGMGSVRVQDMKLVLGSLFAPEGTIAGAKREGQGNPYRLPENDTIAAPPGGLAARHGLFQTLTYENEPLAALADALIQGPLQRYLGGKI